MRASALVVLTSSLASSLVCAIACGPQREAAAPPRGEPAASGESAASATAPIASAPPVATATATAPPVATASPTATGIAVPTAIPGLPWGFPGIPVAGLPASPRAALLGAWKVAGIDGHPVATAPGMGTNPLDPTSYVAGSTVVFTDTTITMSRAGLTVFTRPYKVVSEMPPVRVTIDAGYGPSNVDFVLDGSMVWSLPATPPHALSMTR